MVPKTLDLDTDLWIIHICTVGLLWVSTRYGIDRSIVHWPLVIINQLPTIAQQHGEQSLLWYFHIVDAFANYTCTVSIFSSNLLTKMTNYSSWNVLGNSKVGETIRLNSEINALFIALSPLLVWEMIKMNLLNKQLQKVTSDKNKCRWQTKISLCNKGLGDVVNGRNIGGQRGNSNIHHWDRIYLILLTDDGMWWNVRDPNQALRS